MAMPRFVQYYQRTKNAIHAIQAIAIFVAWALTIAILTKNGKLDGRIWYYFALVSNYKGISLRNCQANAPAVLVLHTCPHLPGGFPFVPTDTPLFQCLCPRCRRHCLYHILACCLCMSDCVGQGRLSCCKGLEKQGQSM